MQHQPVCTARMMRACASGPYVNCTAFNPVWLLQPCAEWGACKSLSKDSGFAGVAALQQGTIAAAAMGTEHGSSVTSESRRASEAGSKTGDRPSDTQRDRQPGTGTSRDRDADVADAAPESTGQRPLSAFCVDEGKLAEGAPPLTDFVSQNLNLPLTGLHAPYSCLLGGMMLCHQAGHFSWLRWATTRLAELSDTLLSLGEQAAVLQLLGTFSRVVPTFVLSCRAARHAPQLGEQADHPT